MTDTPSSVDFATTAMSTAQDFADRARELASVGPNAADVVAHLDHPDTQARIRGLFN